MDLHLSICGSVCYPWFGHPVVHPLSARDNFFDGNNILLKRPFLKTCCPIPLQFLARGVTEREGW